MFSRITRSLSPLQLLVPALMAAAPCALSAAESAPKRATSRVVLWPYSSAVKQLVNLRTLGGGLRFDIRYASPANFTHQQLYPFARAWMRKDAAAALLAAQRDLRAQGLGLKVYDAYRPYHVQQKMWDLVRDERYVSNPAKNAGRHTRGTAVDVTLVDSRGRDLVMPTGFDDFTERAHRGAKGASPEARRNSVLLEQTMRRHGFMPYPYEWWHFDFADWETHPPLDISLTTLEAHSKGSKSYGSKRSRFDWLE